MRNNYRPNRALDDIVKMHFQSFPMLFILQVNPSNKRKVTEVKWVEVKWPPPYDDPCHVI